jgi:hypothetical protein
MKLTTVNKKFKQGIYKPINSKKYRGNIKIKKYFGVLIKQFFYLIIIIFKWS